MNSTPDTPTVAVDAGCYLLSLYVTSTSPRSARAIVNLRRICDLHLAGRYELEVIDIALHPVLARSRQLVAAPTLIRQYPLPERRFVGDMSDTERLLRGLGLPVPAPSGHAA